MVDLALVPDTEEDLPPNTIEPGLFDLTQRLTALLMKVTLMLSVWFVAALG